MFRTTRLTHYYNPIISITMFLKQSWAGQLVIIDINGPLTFFIQPVTLKKNKCVSSNVDESWWVYKRRPHTILYAENKCVLCSFRMNALHFCSENSKQIGLTYTLN